MAQYDYYEAGQDQGYWLDCQTELMADYNTRLVVPLIPIADAPRPGGQLNPVFDIAGDRFFMATHLASAVQTSDLPRAAGSLAGHHYEIVKAFDFLITGV